MIKLFAHAKGGHPSGSATDDSLQEIVKSTLKQFYCFIGLNNLTVFFILFLHCFTLPIVDLVVCQLRNIVKFGKLLLKNSKMLTYIILKVLYFAPSLISNAQIYNPNYLW